MINLNKLKNIPIINLGSIYLRAVEYNDYKDMFEYGSDERVTKTLQWKHTKIEETQAAILESFLKRPERGLPSAYAIILEKNKKMIGTCDFHTIDWDLKQGEIGYALNYDYWGKGYMTMACKAVIKYGFEQLKLEKVVISHEINNIGSQRVIEKSGFIFVEERENQITKTTNMYYEITLADYFKKFKFFNK